MTLNWLSNNKIFKQQIGQDLKILWFKDKEIGRREVGGREEDDRREEGGRREGGKRGVERMEKVGRRLGDGICCGDGLKNVLLLA